MNLLQKFLCITLSVENSMQICVANILNKKKFYRTATRIDNSYILIDSGLVELQLRECQLCFS